MRHACQHYIPLYLSRALWLSHAWCYGGYSVIHDPPYKGCFLHRYNPFDGWSWSLVPLDIKKNSGQKAFTPSLDMSLPNSHPECMSPSLSPWIVDVVCLELHATTFAHVFKNYNLPSSHFARLCLLFNGDWVNFSITVDISTLLYIEA